MKSYLEEGGRKGILAWILSTDHKRIGILYLAAMVFLFFVAVAIGVIGPAGCSNYDDYFWGKGPVGPDIRGANIHGWWRVRYQ